VFSRLKEGTKILFAYSQLLPLCFAVFVSMLGFGLVIPLLPIYARDFGATGTQLGLLTASFAVARLVTTFPGGWLADKAGRKKPIILGLLAYAIVMTLYGFSQDANQLILLRGLQGMASGIVWPIISTMIVDMVLPRDRGKAIGLYEAAHFLGMIIGPAVGGILAETLTVAIPFFLCGLLAFVTSILIAFTVQETFKPKQKTHKTKALPLSRHAYNKGNGKIKQAIKDLTPHLNIFIGLCIARFILAFSNSLMQPVLSVYANEVIGISEATVGILFTVQGIITLFATIPMGTIADDVGRKPMIIIGNIIHSTAAILIILSGSLYPLLFVMMMRGMGRAISNPSITAMFSSLIPVSKRGKSMSVFNIFQNAGLVVGATIGGYLYESSTELPFIACSSVGFFGVLVVLLIISEPKHGLQ
jgi:DHA1 family multidrug resistance protein-like MFS transporter